MADLIRAVWGAIIQDKDTQDLDAGTETGCYWLLLVTATSFHILSNLVFLLCYLTSSLITQIIRNFNVDDR
jgi:hypothetical protein